MTQPSSLSPSRRTLIELNADSVGTASVMGARIGSSIATIESELQARREEAAVKAAQEASIAMEVEEETVAAPVIRVKDPGGPTAEEKAIHDMLHLPHRAWCEICIKARGKEDPHHLAKKSKSESQRAMVSFDYKSYGQETERDDKFNCLIVRDVTKTIYSHLTSKGIGDEWIVSMILRDIDELGHNEVTLKCDGEPAIVQLLKKVKEKRVCNTILEHPPAYDPQSNGVAEKAVQEFMEQLRAVKIALEQRIGIKINTDDAVMPWINDHAAMLLSRFKLSNDGKTAYRRLTGKDCRAPMLEFGERVLAKPKRNPRTTRKVSLKSRWVEGTWVGSTRNSNEHLIILDNGGAAIRVRTVKRRSEIDRWKYESIKGIVATPRNPNPKDDSQLSIESERDTKGARVEIEKLPEVETDDRQNAKRDFKITKLVLDKFGTTDGCPGCFANQVGGRRSHTTECRSRLESRMNENEQYGDRIQRRNKIRN